MKKNIIFFIQMTALFSSYFAYAQSNLQDSMPSVTITKVEDIELLKTLMDNGETILRERKACSTTAKDYKQECFCNKKSQYDQLMIFISDILIPDEHRNWFDALLKFEDSGQSVTTSLTYYSSFMNDFVDACLPNGDGTFRANHEWEKPELHLNDTEDANALVLIQLQQNALGAKVFKCTRNERYTREQCACGYKAEFQAALAYAHSVLRKNPDWKDYVLLFSEGNMAHKMSLEENIRKYNDNINQCKK